jgi:hypothetical protein
MESVITELQDIAEQLETLEERCFGQSLKADEAITAIKVIKERVTDLLPEGSPAFRKLDRMIRSTSDRWAKTESGHVAPVGCTKIQEWTVILRQTIVALDPAFQRGMQGMKKEYLFSPDEEYEARKTLHTIMKGARNSLVIVDPFLDEGVFDYIGPLGPSVNIQMLTGRESKMFRERFKSRAKHINVGVREFQGCDDAFLIIDVTEVWSLGASITDVGRKEFTVSKVTDLNERNNVLSGFQRLWLKGRAISQP